MIVSIVFLVLAALFTFLGVLKGKKYTWVFSAARIVGAVIAALLTMLLSVLLARLVGSLLSGVIGNSLSGNMQGLLTELPSASFALTALIAMLVSPVLFWPIFPIVYNLLNLLLKFISRVLAARMPKKVTGLGGEAPTEGTKRVRNAALRVYGKNPTGMILGGVCGFLLFCIALVPLVGLTGTVYDVAAIAVTASGEDSLPSALTDALDDSVSNAGSVVVRTIGGQALYNGLTTYWAGEDTVHLDREVKLLSSCVGSLTTYSNPKIPRVAVAETVRGIEPALEQATLVPRVGAELVDAASDAWLDDKEYHGIKMPSPAGYESLMKTIVKTQQGATAQTFREDMGTVVHMMAYLIEKDAMGKIQGNAMALFADQELTEALLLDLLENPRLYVTVGSALDLGVDKIADTLQMHKTRNTLYDDLCKDLSAVVRASDANVQEECDRAAKAYRSVLESYGITAEDDVYARAAVASASQSTDMVRWFADEGVVTAETMPQKSILVTSSELVIEPISVQNKENEAKMLAEALATISDVSEQSAASDMDVADFIADFGPALDALSKTETVGREKSGKIFKASLQSKKVSDQIGFSVIEASNAADTINGNADRSSYAVQMLSLSQTVRVIRSAGTAEGDAAIEALIQDLTPESASTLQTLSTPSVMMNHGVSERSSEPVATMMSDMFGNLSDAKQEGMSEEQLQKETAAVNKVMTTGMNASNSNGAAFGEGSATGTSADQFVTDILDSDVVSQTLVEQVYGEGSEPKNDPLLSERTMTAEEEAELMTALNDKWDNATDEQKADEGYQKKLVSIAALMNVAVEVGENGVTKIA